MVNATRTVRFESPETGQDDCRKESWSPVPGVALDQREKQRAQAERKRKHHADDEVILLHPVAH